MPEQLDELIKSAKNHIDLTISEDLDNLGILAQNMLALKNISSNDLRIINRQPETPLAFKIATKLVNSTLD